MKKRILIFNWKMNPVSLKESRALASFVKKAARLPIIIAPPSVFLQKLASLSKKSSKLRIFSQDVSYAPKGAYTGQVSPLMLKSIGVSGSIIGHSERRILLKESDQLISKKIIASLKERLAVVLCVGERERVSLKKAWPIVRKQLEKDLFSIKNSKFQIGNHLTIAYEPAWSIGGGKETDSGHSQKMIKLIKSYIAREYKKRAPVLYGGSINCGNIGSFLKYPQIDGFLVGSASLKKDEVFCIINKITSNKKNK